MIEKTPSGINLQATTSSGPSIPANNILIHDNVIKDVGSASGFPAQGDRLFQFLGGLNQITVRHNTAILPTDESISAASHDGSQPVTDLVVTDNILGAGAFGWKGTGTRAGTATLDEFAPGATFRGNVIVGASAQSYPSDNSFPGSYSQVGFVDLADGVLQLDSNSPFRGAGTDGTDPGVSWEFLVNMIDGVRSPTPQ